MWKDIKDNNVRNFNRTLLKDIAKNDTEVKTKPFENFKKEMWDSQNNEWVAFDLVGAIVIINNRQEQLKMRIWMPTVAQNEVGEIIYAWHPYDTSYLQHSLKEKPYTGLMPQSLQTVDEWLQMIKQDQQEYRYEERYKEIP